jgi:hypothetical protein
MMKKRWSIIATTLFLAILAGCTLPLSMEPPEKIALTQLQPHPYRAGLYIPAELRETLHVVSTSPVDRMSYPIGDQTQQIFRLNLPAVFQEVIAVDSRTPSQPVDVIIEPSIVKFDVKVPMPAYNPYEAHMTYHVDVYNQSGEKIFAQTAVGRAQSSKGLMSGFSARKICATVAQMAMNDSAKQIMEGLAEAEELQQP